MSTAHSPRTAQAFLRRAACSVVGLGCLVTAGAVLSSTVKAPAPAPADRYADMAFGGVETLYAMPTASHPGVRGVQPLKASVRFHRDMIQITNNSRYPWRDVRVRLGVSRWQRVRSVSLGIVAPCETCLLPLDSRHHPYPATSCYYGPLSIRWECRTAQSRGRWQGYLTQ